MENYLSRSKRRLTAAPDYRTEKYALAGEYPPPPTGDQKRTAYNLKGHRLQARLLSVGGIQNLRR